MKFRLVEKITPYRENNDRAKSIADELYYSDIKEMRRLSDRLRRDVRITRTMLHLNVVENDDHTFDIYEGLSFLEGDFTSWEDVVNYCKFIGNGYVQFTPRPKYMKDRDEAIVYNNDKLIKNLKNLIEDKVNIIPFPYADEDEYLLCLWKDGMKASDIIKKYHLDEKYEKIPGNEPSGVIHTDRWAHSRYQGRVSYNDWSGDSSFDEYGEVYEDLSMKDLDDEIQISREY